MKYILGILVALISSGLDFIPTHFSKRNFGKPDLYNLKEASMDDAWARVRKRPWSILHEWVNVLTSYMETSSQEEPAKLIGFIFIIGWFIAFALGLVV